MAVMTDQQRFDAWADYMREASGANETFSLTKADLRAALNAVDQWVSDNASSYNTAIPQPARNALSAAQKARMLMLVVRYRYLLGV